jgi:hypothetical protein
VLSPAFQLLEEPILGVSIDGKLITYYLLFAAVTLLVLTLLRIVNSPFGRVLQAIRENDFRAEAIGFRTVIYRTWSNVLSALFATLAGALLALWLRYVGPDTTLSFEIMIDILLIVVIGGMGTMYGAVIGSVLFVLAQNYLQDLLKLAGSSAGRRARARRRADARPLAALAGRAVRAVGLPLPHRHRGPAACTQPGRRAAFTLRGRAMQAPCKPNRSTWPAKGARSTSPNGASPGTGADRLARPGAHRARHGRHRRAPGAPLARDLPRHAGPRPEPVEPAAGRRILPGLLRTAGRVAGGPTGHPADALAGHVDGRRHRPACGGRPLRGRIERLVLNDIGPQLAEAAVQRIRSYAGTPPAFATMGELEAYFRTVYKPYGWLSDAQWRRWPKPRCAACPTAVSRRTTTRRWCSSSSTTRPTTTSGKPGTPDPARAVPARRTGSDLLLPDVAEAMRTRGPRAVVATIAGCGHAPALNTPEQISLVERFLAA